MIYKSKLESFRKLIEKIELLQNTRNSLVYWDKITCMPPEGIEYRSNLMAFLADEQHKLLSGREFLGYVKYFRNNKRNDEVTNAMVRRICSSSEYVNKIPEEEYKEYAQLFTKAEQVWEKAKDESNFAAIRPYWEKIFKHFMNFAEYWGYEENPYDALLRYYDGELTVKKMDSMAEEMKAVIIELREKISENYEENCQLQDLPEIDEETQKKIWKMLLKEIGFSFKAGRVDIGSHPTILANSPSDVRIVNTCNVKDFRTGIFNVLHAGGKGIYEQSISKELMGTFLAEAPSWVLEEAVGRFYENVIGRSKGFWERFYPMMCDIAPELGKYTPCQIFKSVNCINSSAKRLEADELNFLLHIIIRYEIEREIINGRLEVNQIPAIWKKKCEEYLGVAPKNDGEGALQDIHWSAGYVGYFPTYFVANLTSAQMGAAIERSCGELNTLVREGHFNVINGWMKENIFKHGSIYETAELIEKSTGQPLTSTYYIDYLRDKFSEVYKLKL